MFKVGDVVRLKSGGPEMTVTYLGDGGKVDCAWFNQEGARFEPHSRAFAEAALELVKPAG